LCALPLDQPPLGESAWGATKVLFPADAPTHWINQLTGERFTLDRFGERLELPLARLFQAFPFALLTPTDTLH
jgi:maltooligosyltrehalose synthase